MQRSPETHDNPQYEMTSIAGAHLLKGTPVEMQSSGNASGETKDAEKTAEFRPEETGCDAGVDEIIAIENKYLPNREKKPEVYRAEAVYDSVATMTKAMHQQMDLFRRLMYLMTVLLLIVFLIAVSTPVLAVLMTTGKTFNSDQPTSPPGTFPYTFKS